VSLRLRTAVGPLRLGYGRKLDRMPGESSGELFIAIGETF
jgi:outer membrane translocation and assembly module TamA